jgi:hypothetical protein
MSACDLFQSATGATCGAAPARFYLPGWRCDSHQPVVAPLPPAPRMAAAPPAAPVAGEFPPAAIDLSGAHPCAYCGTEPSGPGGVLCPGCKDALGARSRQRHEIGSA